MSHPSIIAVVEPEEGAGRVAAGSSGAGWWRVALALVARDVRGQYRRSLLGPTWAVLQPLLYLAVFMLVRGVVDLESEGASYALFLLTVLVPWSFFANAVTRCGPSVLMNAGLVKKMPLPREVFPIAAVGTSLVDLVISGLLLGILLLVTGEAVTLQWLWLPVLTLGVALWALGLGFLVASVGTYKRDVIIAVPFLLQLLILASPVMYPLDQVPESWRVWYEWNPAVGLLEGFRAVLLEASPPDLLLLARSAVSVLVLLAIGWPLFRYSSQYFADVL